MIRLVFQNDLSGFSQENGLGGQVWMGESCKEANVYRHTSFYRA